MITDRFYILTGGPGSGKTTLLTALEQAGFNTVAEVARAIIQEQVLTGGTALPWTNQQLYTEQMLHRSVQSYLAVKEQAKSSGESLFFFDRGIPDTLCHAVMTGQGISAAMDAIARAHLYNNTVFILPPWKEIYTTDEERKQNWKEAVLTYGQMKAIYTRYRYQVLDVPTGTPDLRKAFILAHTKG
ncbi:AAA family ATPase [Niabella drilacis]|uniref:Predicted ATPase n=1 Tax=Niabella drilacis (strain DSM 25811 / CCM 8410 / CCUG 62505 / LMG 26954 / E90) TaxID=1285928 RepID=A0A1G6TWN0_NIADE|nr:AAA family ATPase [Niabella drilacis]SDD33324.1 Predicted ATPase [Niabella drilacis]